MGCGGSVGKSSGNKNSGMARAKELMPVRPTRLSSSSLGGLQERQGPSSLAFPRRVNTRQCALLLLISKWG